MAPAPSTALAPPTAGTAGEALAALDPAAVVARFEREVRAYVARRLPGPDADDVAQDALIRILLGVRAVRSPARVAPWVFQVVRSTIVDHHRRSLVRGGVAEADVVAEEAPDDVKALLAVCIEPFLLGLPPEQAEALRRVDLQGQSQVGLAEELGVPVATVKARVQRGRRKLRAAFDACCAFVVDARGVVVEATPRCACP